MIRRFLFTGIVLGAAWMVVTSLPDVARYLKLRDM